MIDRRTSLFLFLILFVSTSSWAAPVQRTFVSTSGNDANDCSRPAPCRSFLAAIAQTQPGGEVYVLDSGGYGTAPITQAVTIRGDAVSAGVSVLGGDGIDVNAGPSDIVTLHGLVIIGLGGANGVSFQNGGVLHLEQVTIAGFLLEGVDMTASGKLFIDDSIIRDNASNEGLKVHPTSGVGAIVSVDHSRFERNNAGIWIADGGFATIRNSVIADNHSIGINDGVTTATGSSEITIENCVSALNNYGIVAQSAVTPAGVNAAIVRISNVTLFGNVTAGLATMGVRDGGAIWSFGNNQSTDVGTPNMTIPQM